MLYLLSVDQSMKIRYFAPASRINPTNNPDEMKEVDKYRHLRNFEGKPCVLVLFISKIEIQIVNCNFKLFMS